jgi:ATP-dependent Clp protease ATP-binding subunit ClpB
LDEVEKAHPDVFNILLQVLDDGRITDSQGRTVDFKNAIIIMTSNLGSQYLLDGIENGQITENARNSVMQLLRSQFRPEFLNRIDEIVFYKPLEKAEITQIVHLLAATLSKRLAQRDITLELTDAAVEAIADAGFDPVYGARPLKRYMQSQLETMLARKIVAAEILPGQRVVVDPQTTLVLHRPLEADEMEPSRAETLASVGRLWAHWPFGSLAADPSLGPNVDPASPYHSLPR